MFFLGLFLILLSHNGQALIVGSNTAPSRQALITFPAADGDNEMRGFAAFENGFILQNDLTSCIFNSVFPVSGDISLNSGALSLSLDLSITRTACILSSGSVYGNNHYLEFPAGQSRLDLPLSTEAILTLVDQKSFSYGVYSTAWSRNDSYLAVGLVSNPGDELIVYSFDGTALTFKDDYAAGNSVYDIAWHPFSDYLAVAINSGVGNTDLDIYYFDGSTIAITDSKDYADDGRAVSWHPSGNYLAVGTADDSQEIIIYSFSTGTGLLTPVTTYNLSPSRDVGVASMKWDPSGNYLAAGVSDYAGAPELLVFYFSGSTLTLTVSNDVGYEVRALDWLPTGTYITIGLAGGTNRVRTYEHRIADGTLTEKVSARIGISEIVRSVSWRPGDEFLAVGIDPSSGQEFRIYSFDKNTFSFSLETGVEVGTNVLSVDWSKSGIYIAVGDYSGVSGHISVYSFFVPGNFFFFDNLTLVLNSDVNFNSFITFHGDCAIEGREHIIDFEEINIDPGSRLLLQNLTLNNISDHKLCCLDSLGTVSLHNVTIVLDGDFSFTLGRFDVLGDVWITGTNIFTYQSDQVSTICSDAILHFDSGTTFSYASTSARNLLAMEDITSILHFYESTLYSIAPGLQLTKGALLLEGECQIQSDATTHDDGITLGDGSSANNDIMLKILPESGPYAMAGWFNYKNVNS